MTAAKKIAQKRLTLLQLAERLRNVSEACRHHGISRSQFYEYKRAFQERGLDRLLDRPPIPKIFPNETLPEVKERIIAILGRRPIEMGKIIKEQLTTKQAA
ncbi:MAG: helix-turn-helix domain-containing protein [Desulfobacterales bacterium]|nr:helix-turn-helix domain-containing protein [Desulfobacterales bacterium]